MAAAVLGAECSQCRTGRSLRRCHVQAPDRQAWLVLSLQKYIDAGFKMATGQVEALKPAGLSILQASAVDLPKPR